MLYPYTFLNNVLNYCCRTTYFNPVRFIRKKDAFESIHFSLHFRFLLKIYFPFQYRPFFKIMYTRKPNRFHGKNAFFNLFDALQYS